MPYTPSLMTSQTGTQYKSNLDADTAALQGVAGKRRNVNGDGRINQLVSTLALSTSWQYLCDMWEAEIVSGTATGSAFGAAASTQFPTGIGIGSAAGLSTTAASVIGFRTKMESANIKDLLAAPYLYPIGGSPQHPFACVSCLVYHTAGQNITVTPILRSADAVDNFTTMTNSLTGAAQSVPSGVVTALYWDTAANSFQLDNLTNAPNGLCLELDCAVPNGVTNIALMIGDVQFEGGQVATPYNRDSVAHELARCQRYFRKTFPYGTAPAQNAGATGAHIMPQIVGAAAAQNGNPEWRFERMIKAGAVTTYNPSAANAQARNLDANADASAIATAASDDSVTFMLTMAAGSATGQRNAIHAVVDARL